MKEKMEKDKKGTGEVLESRYMQLVEEEKDLFRIPKHLDTDLLKKYKLYGEKPCHITIPTLPLICTTEYASVCNPIRERIKALENLEASRRQILKSELEKKLKK